MKSYSVTLSFLFLSIVLVNTAKAFDEGEKYILHSLVYSLGVEAKEKCNDTSTSEVVCMARSGSRFVIVKKEANDIYLSFTRMADTGYWGADIAPSSTDSAVRGRVYKVKEDELYKRSIKATKAYVRR